LNLFGIWACILVLSTPAGGELPQLQLGPPPVAPEKPNPAPAPAMSTQDPPEWSNTDAAWTKEMTLRTELPPVRPEQHTPTYDGSLLTSGQYVRATGGASSSSCARLGGSLTAGNLFGDGSSFGASLGFMPGPEDDFESFADFQIAACCRRVLDDRERLALRGGFEQASHDGTTWVGFYSSSDAGKPALEVTQALLVLTRRFDESSGDDLTCRHQALPRIDRDGETTPPATLEEIEDDHLDKLAASAFLDTDGHLRLHGEAGAGYEEDETGGSADAGPGFPELLINEMRTDFTAFGSRGQFTTPFVGRVTCSLTADDGRWDFSYEYANHRLHGISSNLNDLVQQRVWLGRSFHWSGGWSFSLDAQATWWDTEVSWAAGWLVQKTF